MHAQPGEPINVFHGVQFDVYLLFPGRHILNTAFQERYLTTVLSAPPGSRPDLVPGVATPPPRPIDEIVFAVTSSNKSNSRYNPLPLETRAIIVYEFARQWKRQFGIDFRIVGIPHYRPTDRFCELLLKEVAEQTDGAVTPGPADTIVLTSTPAVIAAFQALGYAILPAEYDIAAARHTVDVPTDLVHAIGNRRPIDDIGLSRSSRTVFADLPEAAARIVKLYNDPILTEQGDLTETRDYGTYTRSMTNVIDIKYRDIKELILPGKIVDDGCADGALIEKIVSDFPDSDIIGVDLSAEMLARANELKRAGAFGNAFVFFKQQNLTTPVTDAQASTADTIICNSTLHELWSYGRRADSVREYLHGKCRQLRRGGHLVIRDVVGPEDGDRPVVLWCADTDGTNPIDYGIQPAMGQSTWSRFLKFVAEFGPRRISYELGSEPGIVRLTVRDAMEFISKMEYTDNWSSELHEEFCFWSLTDWKREITDAGFFVLPESHAYLNQWRVEHRFAGHVLLRGESGAELPFPVTNMVVAGEKREADRT